MTHRGSVNVVGIILVIVFILLAAYFIPTMAGDMLGGSDTSVSTNSGGDETEEVTYSERHNFSYEERYYFNNTSDSVILQSVQYNSSEGETSYYDFNMSSDYTNTTISGLSEGESATLEYNGTNYTFTVIENHYSFITSEQYSDTRMNYTVGGDNGEDGKDGNDSEDEEKDRGPSNDSLWQIILVLFVASVVVGAITFLND